MKKSLLLFSACMILMTACSEKTENNIANEDDIIIPNNATIISPQTPSDANYLGGVGKIRQLPNSVYFEDDANIYFPMYSGTLNKLNKTDKTYSVACNTPGCAHNAPYCRAYLSSSYYTAFGDTLVKMVNESVANDDGTFSQEGHLLSCDPDGSEKKLFTMEIPDSLMDGDTSYLDKQIIWLENLGNEYIVAENSYYTYLLDKDLNIRATWYDSGSAMFSCLIGDKIYYINNLMQLICMDTADFAPYIVDTEGDKLIEGAVMNDILCFVNENKELKAMDMTDLSQKKLADNAIRISANGDFISYMTYSETEGEESRFVCISPEGEEIVSLVWDDFAGSTVVEFDGEYYLHSYEGLIRYDENFEKRDDIAISN